MFIKQTLALNKLYYFLYQQRFHTSYDKTCTFSMCLSFCEFCDLGAVMKITD